MSFVGNMTEVTSDKPMCCCVSCSMSTFTQSADNFAVEGDVQGRTNLYPSAPSVDAPTNPVESFLRPRRTTQSEEKRLGGHS